MPRTAASWAPGESGELFVRGEQVSGSYTDIGSVLDADGWFPTKDVAMLDEGGYLFIGGRSDDTIIRGGENIAPAEIEDVLVEHPSVRDCAVVGAEDPEWGQIIVAVVVPAPRCSHRTPRSCASIVRSAIAWFTHPRPGGVPRRTADQRDRQSAAPRIDNRIDAQRTATRTVRSRT